MDIRKVICTECNHELKIPMKNHELIAPYLIAVLTKLSNNEFIFIKTPAYPDRMAKAAEILEMIKPYGIVEPYNNREFYFVNSPKNFNQNTRWVSIKWELHPKLITYREQNNLTIKK